MPAAWHGHPAALWMATRGFLKGGAFHGRDFWLSDGKGWTPIVKRARLGSLPITGLQGSQGLHFYALSGPVGPRCSESGKISSECAVTRAEPVFGFCGALVLAVVQLSVRWRSVGPLLGQWPDFGG
jgi:hypothetical protein